MGSGAFLRAFVVVVVIVAAVEDVVELRDGVAAFNADGHARVWCYMVRMLDIINLCPYNVERGTMYVSATT